MKKCFILLMVLNVAIIFMLACGGGSNIMGTNPSPTNKLVGIISNLVKRHNSVYSHSPKSVVAESNFSLIPKAYAQGSTTASVIPESFEADCDWIATRRMGLHAAMGTTGLAPLNIPANSGLCGNHLAGSMPSLLIGQPTTFSGTFELFVAYATTVNGMTLRCVDTTNQTSVTDQVKYLPYYDLAHDQLILVNVSTQTPITMSCAFTIPSGDDIASIEFRWAKA